MAGVIHQDREGDDSVLTERRDGVDGAEKTFLSDFDEHTSSCQHAVRIGVGNAAIDFEVGEVADDCHFGTRSDDAADFGTDVGEGCLAGRTDVGTIEGTARLLKTLVGNAILQLFHAQVGFPHPHLVFVLLPQLLQLHLCSSEGDFSLMHTVFRA